RTVTRSGGAAAACNRVPTSTPAPTRAAAAIASGTMQPIGTAMPTSRPPCPGCSPDARRYRFRALTAGGSNQRRKPMPIPPVVDEVLVVFGFLFVGVERGELIRAGVAVQVHPYAPARSHQQPLPLAGFAD